MGCSLLQTSLSAVQDQDSLAQALLAPNIAVRDVMLQSSPLDVTIHLFVTSPSATSDDAVECDNSNM